MTQPARPAIEPPGIAQLAAHVLTTLATASYAAAVSFFVLQRGATKLEPAVAPTASTDWYE